MTAETQRALEAICQQHGAIIIDYSTQRLRIATAETPPH